MGFISHDAILVTSFDKKLARKARKQAIEIFGTIVSEVHESIMNSYHSFAVFPDGSKEGWEDSDRGDANRAQFIAWLEAQRYNDRSTPYDWVEVQYGNDDHETKIIIDSDAWSRQEIHE